MTPTDFAAEELAAWERALEEQHEAERQAYAARHSRDFPSFSRALKQADEARDRAALLLAAAVAKKRSFGG